LKGSDTRATVRELFLLQDFASTQSYRIHFSQMRMASLGGALTLILGIVGFAEKEVSSANLALTALILLVDFALIQVEGHLSRGIAVFSSHMAWIERQLGVVGLASYLPDVISRHPRYTGTNAFAITLRCINIAAAGYAASQIVACANAQVISRPLEGLLIAAALLILAYNDWNVRRSLASARVRHEVTAAMSEAQNVHQRERGTQREVD
jgi:hypothetical protein